MAKFEYETSTLSNDKEEKKLLEGMDANGWELISVCNYRTYIKYYFKREKPQTK